MVDLICRKSITRCLTPGMCSPHGGCQAPENSSAFRALLAERNSLAYLLKRFVDGEHDQDENQAERHMYHDEAQTLLAYPGWPGSRLHADAGRCASGTDGRAGRATQGPDRCVQPHRMQHRVPGADLVNWGTPRSTRTTSTPSAKPSRRSPAPGLMQMSRHNPRTTKTCRDTRFKSDSGSQLKGGRYVSDSRGSCRT